MINSQKLLTSRKIVFEFTSTVSEDKFDSLIKLFSYKSELNYLIF